MGGGGARRRDPHVRKSVWPRLGQCRDLGQFTSSRITAASFRVSFFREQHTTMRVCTAVALLAAIIALARAAPALLSDPSAADRPTATTPMPPAEPKYSNEQIMAFILDMNADDDHPYAESDDAADFLSIVDADADRAVLINTNQPSALTTPTTAAPTDMPAIAPNTLAAVVRTEVNRVLGAAAGALASCVNVQTAVDSAVELVPATTGTTTVEDMFVLNESGAGPDFRPTQFWFVATRNQLNIIMNTD